MKTDYPVLIVAGQWSIPEAVESALHDIGFPDVLIVSSGIDAIKTLQSKPVSAVISDWNVGAISGLGLLRWIRNEQAYAALPFMLVTAQADQEMVRAAVAAGASECLVKPYTVQDLANRMTRILGRGRNAPLSNQTIAQRVIGLANVSRGDEQNTRPTILIVDDIPFNCAAISSFLKGSYDTLTANSGAQAIKLANGEQTPDLILLDVMMPGMDGYEVCKQLKSNQATKEIPIVFLTGQDEARDVVRGLESGAVDYISKPVAPDILKARIRTHLRLQRAFVDLAIQNKALSFSAQMREDLERLVPRDSDHPIAKIMEGSERLIDMKGLTEEQTEILQMIQREVGQYKELTANLLAPYGIDLASNATNKVV